MFKWSGREYLLIGLKPGLHFHHAISYRLKQWCGQFGSKYRSCSIWTLKWFVLSYKSNTTKLSWFVYFEQLKTFQWPWLSTTPSVTGWSNGVASLDQNIAHVAFELWNVSTFRIKVTTRNFHGSFVLNNWKLSNNL